VRASTLRLEIEERAETPESPAVDETCPRWGGFPGRGRIPFPCTVEGEPARQSLSRAAAIADPVPHPADRAEREISMRSADHQLPSTLIALAAFAAVTGLGSLAAAQQAPAGETSEEGLGAEEGYPLVYTQRPLTLGEGLLRIDAELEFVKLCGSAAGITVCSDLDAALAVGAGYGITSQLEVGATVLPLALAPEVDYGDPSIYGKYTLVEGELEVGARLEVWFPVRGDFAVQVGVPIDWKPVRGFALHSGAFLTIMATDPTHAAVSIPFVFVVNATDSLFFGLATGVVFAVTDPGPGDTLEVPLGLELGYSVPGEGGGPLLDILGGFEFASFIGASEGVSVETWMASLSVRVYLDTQP
jgi:hypothetical protein